MNLTEDNLLTVQSMAPPLSHGTFQLNHNRCFLIFKPNWRFLTLQILSHVMTVLPWATYDVTSAVAEEGYDVPDARALVKYKKEWSKSSVTCVLPEDGKCVMYVMDMGV